MSTAFIKISFNHLHSIPSGWQQKYQVNVLTLYAPFFGYVEYNNPFVRRRYGCERGGRSIY